MANELAGALAGDLFGVTNVPLTGKQRIARALMGFGAGSQGRGQEFIASLHEQDQALSLERQQAMVQDAMRASSMLSNGRVEDALKLIDDRVEQINKLGGDPSDTLGIRNLIASGRSKEALQEIGIFLDAARQRGLLPESKAPEIVPSSSISNGQVTVRNPVTGDFEAQNVSGYQVPAQEQFEVVTDSQGLPVGQRNTRTNQISGLPETMTKQAADSQFSNVARLESGQFVGLRNGQIELVPESDSAIPAFQASQEIKRVNNEANALGSGYERASKLRSEIARATGEFQKIRGAWDRIQASAQAPSGASDVALIFNFMKMLDPGSVVREGEFATAQNTGGVDDRVRNVYNQLLNGERLTPDQRKDFAYQARAIFDRAAATNTAVLDGFVNIGEGMGLKRDQIVVEGLDTVPQGGQAVQGNEAALTPEEWEELRALRTRYGR